MKKQIKLVIMATEEMRIEIGGDNDIDLSTLTKVLSNTMIALNNIAKASVGDDTSCRFVVKNIEKGSFIIDIAQFVTVGVQLFPTFASVIDTFKNVLEIRNVLRGEQPKSVMYTGNGNIVINGSGNSVIVNGNAYTIYSNDPGIEKSCAEAVEAVSCDGSRTGLIYRFEKETVGIEKEDLKALSIKNDIQQLRNNVKQVTTNRMKLKAFKPDLQGTSKWGIEILGKQETAEITDEEFLKKVHDSEVSFASGTVMDADVVAIFYSDSSGKPLENPKPRYRISKVYEVINATVEKKQLEL